MFGFWNEFRSALNFRRGFRRYFAPLVGAVKGAIKETREGVVFSTSRAQADFGGTWCGSGGAV